MEGERPLDILFPLDPFILLFDRLWPKLRPCSRPPAPPAIPAVGGGLRGPVGLPLWQGGGRRQGHGGYVDDDADPAAAAGGVPLQPVLEIGCGKGFAGEYLKEEGFHNVYGIDCSYNLLSIA